MASKENCQVTLALPDEFDANQRLLAGDLIMDKIRANCADGRDMDGKKFSGYSKEYMASIDFKIAGKGKTVTLSQSGDTLASMQIISHRPGAITIGYPLGSEYAEIVEGLQDVQGRWFLGLPQNQLDLIIEEVRSQSPGVELRRSAISSVIEGLIRRFG